MDKLFRRMCSAWDKIARKLAVVAKWPCLAQNSRSMPIDLIRWFMRFCLALGGSIGILPVQLKNLPNTITGKRNKGLRGGVDYSIVHNCCEDISWVGLYQALGTSLAVCYYSKHRLLWLVTSRTGLISTESTVNYVRDVIEVHSTDSSFPILRDLFTRACRFMMFAAIHPVLGVCPIRAENRRK